MDRNALINCFQDTLRTCEQGELKSFTKKAAISTKVYKENFHCKSGVIQEGSTSVHISVVKGTSFATAKEYVGQGKIGVLNFANPHNPGGGVVNGAMAQEECLCRSSNLYPCLLTPQAKNDYYDYNKQITNTFFSDRIVYTDSVTVFKTDDEIPVLMTENEWFDVSVLTCAAPYIAKRKYTNKAALKEIFKNRIKNIFSVAIDNNIEILILGAFGCGAFKNPPEIVATAFKETINENMNVLGNLKQIVFTIKVSSENESYNYMCFNKIIYGWNGITANCPDYELPEIKLPNGNILPKAITGYTHMGVYTTIDEVKELVAQGHYMSSDTNLTNEINLEKQAKFLKWQYHNEYFGKQFSILGDSISTLDCFNPKGYNVFFKDDNCMKANVYEINDTWWGKVIDFFGGELLVNNSWSGSRVTKLPSSDTLFPSGCSDERTNGLHINNVKPDIIIVYLGTNDWANGVETEYVDYLGEDITPSSNAFLQAYQMMIDKIKTNYQNSEIWCCTLNSTYMSSNPKFSFPETYKGSFVEDYNDVIRDVAKNYKCKLIDLYSFKTPYDTIDGSHPNERGMSTLATLIINSICSDGGVDFLNINNDSKHTDNDFAYEYKDPNITRCLYNEELNIFIKSENQEKIFTKSVVDIGRNKNCDIIFEQNGISRHHARLYFEESTWYIADVGSTNGVWLNETKLVPRTKYELFSDDVIDIAHKETIIFFKSKYNSAESIDEKKSKSLNLVQCDKGHYYNTNKYDICPHCSNSKNKGELVNTLIDNKYRLISQIGKGGFTKTYLAQDINTNKMWAVKICDKSNSQNANVVINNILNEASLIKRLDHPSIPRIVDIINNDDMLCIAEDYIEGETLEAIVKEYGAQSQALVVKWAKQLCNVLGYLHTLNPPHIYRDVKPANIILQPNGKIMLIDFGIMRTYKPNQSTDTVALGTKGYAAPEQYGARQTDARTDIYGLGMTMHQLLTGVDPKTNNVPTLPICQINSNLPKDLEHIVNKCIELDPDKRYQSMNELAIALDSFNDNLRAYPNNKQDSNMDVPCVYASPDIMNSNE